MVVILLPRVLKLNDKGDDVYALKRALSMAGYGRWLGAQFTHLLGDRTVILINQFRKAHGLPQNGTYDAAMHKLLAPHYDAYGASLMNAAYHALHLGPAAKAVDAALEMYNYHRLTGRTSYTQGPSRWSIIAEKLLPPMFRSRVIRADCSASVTGQDWIGSNPDPNHLNFTAGYTGTLSVHGERITKPVVGALGFFGWRWPYTHVIRCVGIRSSGAPLSWSFGSNPPRIVEGSYGRPDFSHWRRYY